jgi:hypothetical protein
MADHQKNLNLEQLTESKEGLPSRILDLGIDSLLYIFAQSHCMNRIEKQKISAFPEDLILSGAVSFIFGGATYALLQQYFPEQHQLNIGISLIPAITNSISLITNYHGRKKDKLTQEIYSGNYPINS